MVDIESALGTVDDGMGTGAAGLALAQGTKFECRWRYKLYALGYHLVDVVIVDGGEISAVGPDQAVFGILKPYGQRAAVENGAQALDLFGELADVMGELGDVAALARE